MNGTQIRSLPNYLNEEKHKKAAERRGNLKEFLKAPTLTQARKLAYGEKRKNK